METRASDTTVAGVAAINTTGSIIHLKFGDHINLVSDWNAPSSIGNFSFQVACNVYNNTGGDINANDYELFCTFVNSGIIVTSLGSTSVYQGLLCKKDVLDVASKPAVNAGEYARMYGGAWYSGIKSAVSGALALAPKVLAAAPHLVNAYKSLTAGAGRAAGYASGYATGAPSNGKLKDRFY